MTSLFIQIFYIRPIDSGLFWNLLWNNYNIARFHKFQVLVLSKHHKRYYREGTLKIQNIG